MRERLRYFLFLVTLWPPTERMTLSGLRRLWQISACRKSMRQHGWEAGVAVGRSEADAAIAASAKER